MPQGSDMLRLRARWIFPVDRPPIENGILTIHEERIESVEPSSSGTAATDLGDVAILPGLVNAHTHLEFSDLTAPIGDPGIPFPDWIRAVVEYRRNRSAAERIEAMSAAWRSAGGPAPPQSAKSVLDLGHWVIWRRRTRPRSPCSWN